MSADQGSARELSPSANGAVRSDVIEAHPAFRIAVAQALRLTEGRLPNRWDLLPEPVQSSWLQAADAALESRQGRAIMRAVRAALAKAEGRS